MMIIFTIKISAVVVVVRRAIIIRGGALPVKRVIGVADTVAVAVGHFRQTAVIDVALIFVGREVDGRGVPLSLRARGADPHARHVAEGVIAQQVVLPVTRRAQVRLADEVGQLRAVVDIVDRGRTANVGKGSAVAACIVPVLLLCAVAYKKHEHPHQRMFVLSINKYLSDIHCHYISSMGGVLR